MKSSDMVLYVWRENIYDNYKRKKKKVNVRFIYFMQIDKITLVGWDRKSFQKAIKEVYPKNDKFLNCSCNSLKNMKIEK